jgi:prevent-host-death family protein
MKPSESIKPISYLKAHAAEVIREINETPGTYIITQNGEAKAILQDIKSYESTQESLTMLKILALGEASLKQGKYKPLKTAFADIRRKIKAQQQ